MTKKKIKQVRFVNSLSDGTSFFRAPEDGTLSIEDGYVIITPLRNPKFTRMIPMVNVVEIIVE
jgi:hypothetical protein